MGLQSLGLVEAAPTCELDPQSRRPLEGHYRQPSATQGKIGSGDEILQAFTIEILR